MLYPSEIRQALNSCGSSFRLRDLSKWRNDLRNSSICSLEMPLESRVKICQAHVNDKNNSSTVCPKGIRPCTLPSIHSQGHYVWLIKSIKIIGYFLIKKQAVTINRSKIGHYRLTHSYLLCGEDQPTSAHCDAQFTVKHILLDCPDLQDIQQKYFTASSLKVIFASIEIKTSLVLLKMLIFIINCSICYPCFTVTTQLWFNLTFFLLRFTCLSCSYLFLVLTLLLVIPILS